MGYLDKVRHFLQESPRVQEPVKSGQECDSAPAGEPEASETTFSIADEVERMIALGARLKRGDISAVRCGATGKRCNSCAGIPCLGSEPWEDC